MAVPSSWPLGLLFLLLGSAVLAAAGGEEFAQLELPSGGRAVGRRAEVADVSSNEEVQKLGRFSVEEYNRSLRRRGASPLAFARVVEAQRQVVSGLKYFLRVAAVTGRHAEGVQSFDAVVQVTPWLGSKELLSFTPSSD